MPRKDGKPRSLPAPLALDPLPWRGYDMSRKSRYSRFACIFDPRPGYPQNREDYE